MRPTQSFGMSLLKAALALCALILLAVEARGAGVLSTPAAALASDRACLVATAATSPAADLP